MTHFKKDWMQLLTGRIKLSKRVIVKKELFPSLLCRCMQNGMGNISVKIINTTTSTIINR